MSSLRSALKTVDRYWFGCGSPTSLGVLRILMGFLTAIDLIVLGIRWEDWFSEKGFVPKSLAQMWFVGDPYVWYHGAEAPIWAGGRILPKINLLFAIDNPVLAQAFFWGVFVCAILTMFGLWTRVSTFLLAVGIVSIHHRNPMILMGGDTVMRLSCLYLAIAPCGAACSVDRLIALWRGKIQPGPVSVSLWSQRIITYNVAVVYLTTAWLKRFGYHWVGGDAVYFTANLPEFFRFPYPHLLDYRPIAAIVTWGTLGVEFLLGTLVFYRPARKYILILGVLLHGSIEYTMNVPLFGYLLVSWYICFYDGEEVSEWFARLGARLAKFQIIVRLPEGKLLQPNVFAVLRAVDPLNLVRYEQGDEKSYTITRADGTPAGGLWSVMTRSIGAWPFVALPWIWRPFLADSLGA